MISSLLRALPQVNTTMILENLALSENIMTPQTTSGTRLLDYTIKRREKMYLFANCHTRKLKTKATAIPSMLLFIQMILHSRSCPVLTCV